MAPISLTMDTKTYQDPWTGVDRQAYQSVWRAMLGLWLTGPVMFGLLAWGSITGFLGNGHLVMQWALVVAIVFMVLNLAVYQKISDATDAVSEEANHKMWETVSASLRTKYGPGTVVPIDNDPSIIAPPDGGTKLMDKLEEKIFGKSVKVLWTPEEGDPVRRMLSVAPRTFEPSLDQLPQKTPKKKQQK